MGAAETIQHIPTGDEPILVFMKWVALLVVVALVGMAPIMSYIRKFKSDAAASAKDEASVTLYTQLQDQITRLSADMTALIAEKNRWFEEATNLRVIVADQERRIERLVESEDMNRRLRDKLAEKDKIIAERDAENRQLMLELMNLKDRMHTLEIRLMRDEERFCEGCAFAGKAKPTSLPV